MKREEQLFKRLYKEVKELTGFDLYSLQDKQVQIKLIRKAVPYILLGYLGNLLSYRYRVSKEADMMGKLADTINSLHVLWKHPLPSLCREDLLAGFGTGIFLFLFIYFKKKNAKKYRNGKEYGSAELGTERDISPFINKENPDQNLILSQTEFMSLEGRMPNPLYNRNKNVLVVGGSGSGKTRFYAKPNLMQLNCSYVFTDPKGTVLEECGHLLKEMQNQKINSLLAVGTGALLSQTSSLQGESVPGIAHAVSLRR